MSRIVLKHTRTVDDGDQKYNLDYCLLEDGSPEKLYITASLKMISQNGSTHQSVSNVTVPCMKFGERLFTIISRAENPVFPIHMPEIVRDEALISVDCSYAPTGREDPLSR